MKRQKYTLAVDVCVRIDQNHDDKLTSVDGDTGEGLSHGKANENDFSRSCMDGKQYGRLAFSTSNLSTS